MWFLYMYLKLNVLGHLLLFTQVLKSTQSTAFLLDEINDRKSESKKGPGQEFLDASCWVFNRKCGVGKEAEAQPG